MGADTLAIKEKHELNRIAGEEEWMEKDTEIWKAKEKAMDTNTSCSPGYQSQPNSLETRLVRKWGDIHTNEPMDQWMDGLQIILLLLFQEAYQVLIHGGNIYGIDPCIALKILLQVGLPFVCNNQLFN